MRFEWQLYWYTTCFAQMEPRALKYSYLQRLQSAEILISNDSLKLGIILRNCLNEQYEKNLRLAVLQDLI